ncbi:MAG: exodeoxyribonuclease VII large subunit [Lachnospiraceae bacterium]
MGNIYSVTQVNTYIKNMFTQDYLLQLLSIKGEISNCKYHSSGHIYFTLKDFGGNLSCIMFAGYAKSLKFHLENGQKIIVTGSMEVYERDGKYQCYVKSIKLDGLGDLYVLYEKQKTELEEMGMFDPIYKKKIPKYVQRVGIVTAPTGAAVRDIIQIATRRNPFVQIIVYPALVQGEGAAQSIVNGIHAFERLGVDVMIVGRGGGSIEDLWAFNERIVADAIFQSEIPVISAVGHETDTTIADFVSDLRAPTPSAAAELAVYDIQVFFNGLMLCRDRLDRSMNATVQSKYEIVEQYKRLIEMKHPDYKLREQRMQLMQLQEKLQNSIDRRLQDRKHQLALLVRQLQGLSPLEKLEQGLAYVSAEDGSSIHSIKQVYKDTQITIHLKDGTVQAKVLRKDDYER